MFLVMVPVALMKALLSGLSVKGLVYGP